MEKHAFHSRSASNTPRRMQLHLVDGTPTDAYFDVVFELSDTFDAARRAYRHLLTENAESKNPDKDFADTKRQWLLAHAVVGWSFDEPVTVEAVEEFLQEAPHIFRDLDDLVYDKTRFFGKA